MMQIRAVAVAPETKLVLLASVLRFASAPTADLSFCVLALLALRGRAGAIQALATTWLFLMINPAIAPNPAYASVGRYLVLFAAALMLFVRPTRSSAPRPVKVHAATLALSVFIFYHSLLFSPFADVSLLKAVAWSMSLAVLLLCWQGLRPHEREHTENFLYLLMAAIFVLSIPMLTTAAGRAINGTGFQGVLGHPQTFGISIAMFGAWTALKILCMPKATLGIITLVPACCAFIVLSEARTALIAMLAGVLGAVLLGGFLSGRRVRDIMPGLRNPRLGAWMFLGIVMAPILAVMLEPVILNFIDKRSGSGDFMEAYRASRGFLIEAMVQNIEKNFFIGIGFGIASLPEEMDIIRDPIFRLPISALVEKGALPFAVFEELGVFGFSLALIWIGTVLVQSARSGVAPLGMILVFLLVNMGEATLFSPGGFGLIGLIFVAWGVTSGQPHMLRGPAVTYPVAATRTRPTR